jgi:hypothetical protein
LGRPLVGLVALRLHPVAIIAMIASVVAVVWMMSRMMRALGIYATFPGPTLLVLVVIACCTGYLVLRPTLNSDAAETGWLRSLPLRPGQVSDIEALAAGLATGTIATAAIFVLGTPATPPSAGWLLASSLAAVSALASLETASRQRPSRGVLVLAAAIVMNVLVVLGAAVFHTLVPGWALISTGSVLSVVLSMIVHARTRG